MKTPSETLKFAGVKPETYHALCLDLKDEDTVVKCITVRNVINTFKIWKRRVFQIETEHAAKLAEGEGVLVVLVDEQHRYVSDFTKRKIKKPPMSNVAKEFLAFEQREIQRLNENTGFSIPKILLVEGKKESEEEDDLPF